jgi:hypothetical protein
MTERYPQVLWKSGPKEAVFTQPPPAQKPMFVRRPMRSHEMINAIGEAKGHMFAHTQPLAAWEQRVRTLGASAQCEHSRRVLTNNWSLNGKDPNQPFRLTIQLIRGILEEAVFRKLMTQEEADYELEYRLRELCERYGIATECEAPA